MNARIFTPPQRRGLSIRGMQDRPLRYLLIVDWARNRYTDARGYLTIDTGGIASRFSRIENAAAVKYLGTRDYLAMNAGRVRG